MDLEIVLKEIGKSHKVKMHPTLKDTIVVYNIDLKETSRISKRYACSGTYHDWDNTAILTNFGKYNQ